MVFSSVVDYICSIATFYRFLFANVLSSKGKISTRRDSRGFLGGGSSHPYQLTATQVARLSSLPRDPAPARWPRAFPLWTVPLTVMRRRLRGPRRPTSPSGGPRPPRPKPPRPVPVFRWGGIPPWTSPSHVLSHTDTRGSETGVNDGSGACVEV